ncbi:hypothetical protein P2318_27065 [Myxococcaceae bacterium GXIMD 01537]
MSGSLSRPVLGLLLAGALLAGCGTDPRVRLSRAEARSRELNAAALAADQAVESVAAYSTELSSPQSARGSFSMYYSPASLEQVAGQMLPYKMSGKDFHKQLSGEITVERISDVRFTSRNRLTCRLHLSAQNVRYTGSVPSFFKKEVQGFERAVASGGYADLEVQLTLRDNQVLAQARATGVTLRQPTDRQADLLNAMNERAFNRPLVFNMSIAGGSQSPRRLLVTGNHVIVTYQ